MKHRGCHLLFAGETPAFLMSGVSMSGESLYFLYGAVAVSSIRWSFMSISLDDIS